MPSFYEFFAGGGMVRAGLGSAWSCLFANDFDPKKAMAYQANWGCNGELRIGDIAALSASELPARADLMWGSFPCQDLSLAGAGAGLRGARSGTFYPFWALVSQLEFDHRAPRIVAVENVVGALTSHKGQDFEAIMRTFEDHGYRAGALVVNADIFVPQSRPRLFVVGIHYSVDLRDDLIAEAPVPPFHSTGLIRAVERLPADLSDRFLWWNMPTPPLRNTAFADMIEENPTGVTWHSADETNRLLEMMSSVNRAKVDAARRAGRRMVGGVYRRTRKDEAGEKIVRAEVRFDEVAGCLRTPSGGSSRQTIIIVDGQRVRSRLLSARETARLMGLDDGYALPRNYNEAYHLTGDGVAVPVVRHISAHVFEPLLGFEAIPDETADRVA
ncbi:MAG: DNA cytosine methyltransferase [Pikeienuella sp.]|uniref:DNA cytosine methyltransferase n=1 Tax=Pikeienuella sp. TaxID=2831957 RepID=UPI00391B910A